MLARICCLMIAMVAPLVAAAVPCALDPLLKAPDNWQMTPDQFEQSYTLNGNKLYAWLTKERTRAKLSCSLYANATIQLSAFNATVPAQEAIVDFAGGRLNLVTISFYNRGDNGTIGADEFQQRFTNIGKALSEILQVKPQRRAANPNSGLLTEGFSWFSPKFAHALLEHNEGALTGQPREFLRLRIARPDATGSLAASIRQTRGTGAARLGDLPSHLVKDASGDVFIDKLPMVDQGNKGYCVAASVQRLFEYYGMGADMHQIAQIAESDPQRGTNTLLMAKELDKIDYRFQTRLEIIGLGQPMTQAIKRKNEYYVGKPVNQNDFLKAIHNFVNQGLPLLWALELGRYPETPQLTPQAAGGHMRIIIGYNDKTNELLFTDSWGAGHELKRMDQHNAYLASHGLFVLKPTVR